MLKVLKPTLITEPMLLSSTVAEADYAAWVATTSYVPGDRTIYAHAIYQCAVAITGNASNPNPATDTATWVRVGPTNRWAMFDTNVNTRTVGGAGGLTVAIAPGRCNGVALLDMVGVTAATLVCSYPIAVQAGKPTETVVTAYAFGITQTRVTNYGAGTVTQTYAITLEARNVSNWRDYFVNPFATKSDVFIGFSSRSDYTITLTISTANPQVGWMLAGNYIELGDVGYGVRAGIDDYSVKTTDQWGVTKLVERDYVKRVTYPVTVDNTFLRQTFSALADLRAKPSLFVGTDDYRYTPFTVFGHVANFEAALSFATYSIVNVEVKGLIL